MKGRLRYARVLASLTVVLAVLAAGQSLFSEPLRTPLKGNVFSHPPPAADFTLTDQHGKPFRMADTRGKVVVLTYIYTHCTDFCPFVALKLKQAVKLLGKEAEKAVFVAVSTDPERDTPPVCADYSRAVGMFDSWHFVTGPVPRVRKVWKDYYIGVEKDEAKPASAPASAGKIDAKTRQELRDEAQKVANGLSTEDRALVGRVIDRFGGGYEVSHDIPFWFVDRNGLMRADLEADATPADIAYDVRVLLTE